MKGKRIKTIRSLMVAARNRKAVIIPKSHAWRKPNPAAVIINLPAMLVFQYLEIGLYIYNKPEKLKYERQPSWQWGKRRRKK